MRRPHLTNFKQGETLNFLLRLIERILNFIEGLNLENDFNDLKTKVELAKEHFRPDTLVISTAEIANSDLWRDGIYLYLRALVSAHTNSYKEEVRKAAELIMICIGKYGTRIDIQNYVLETSSLTGICSELTTSAELIAAVELLGITQVVADLQAANLNFDQLYNKRLDEKEKQNEITFAQYLSDATKACTEFYNLVEAGDRYAKDLDFSILIKKMETLAIEYNEIAERTSGSTKGATEEEEPQE